MRSTVFGVEHMVQPVQVDVRQEWRVDTPLRCSLGVAPALDFAVSIPFLDRCVDPMLDQSEHTSVHYAHPHASHQLVVRDAVEVTLHVCVDHRAAALGEVLADDFQRIVRAAPGRNPCEHSKKSDSKIGSRMRNTAA
jgi:hypothetical protein